MKKNLFVKASTILATAIMTVSTIGMTVYGAEEINNEKSITLHSTEVYAGETVEIPLTMKTDNQCTSYDLLVEFDSNFEFISVKGAKASMNFEQDGRKFVSLAGYDASPYQDDTVTASIKLYVPPTVEHDSYNVSFSEISGFSSDNEDFENYKASDAVVSVVSLANVNPASKIKPNEKHSECKVFQKYDKDGKVIESKVGFRGDANDDGKADIKDALTIAKACAGRRIDGMAEHEQFFGDVNEDGKVSIKDAVTIARFIAHGKTSWDQIIK